MEHKSSASGAAVACSSCKSRSSDGVILSVCEHQLCRSCFETLPAANNVVLCPLCVRLSARCKSECAVFMMTLFTTQDIHGLSLPLLHLVTGFLTAAGQAELELAEALRHGGIVDGVKQTPGTAAAFAHYERSSNQGNAEATFKLSMLLMMGFNCGRPCDIPRSVKLLEAAMEAKYLPATSRYGQCVYHGICVKADPPRAVQIWQDGIEDPSSRLFYAVCQNAGLADVKQDRSAAKQHFERAHAELLQQASDPLVMYTIAEAHQFGFGVIVDYTKAAKWMLDAANAGHANAQRLLGENFAHGRGVRQSGTEAVKWFTASASQGHRIGQFRLAECFVEGKHGLRVNAARGMQLLRESAAQGYDEAVRLLNRLKG